MFGQDGNDKLYVVGNDNKVDGGAGSDQAIVQDAAGVTITLIGIESATGGNGNDVLNGTGLAAQISMSGGGGNDTLTGGTKGDWITGGIGNDQVNGGAGSDTLFGNEADDQLFGGDGNDSLYGGTGTDSFTTGTGTDSVFIQNSSGIDTALDFTDGSDMFNFSLHTVVNGFGDLTITADGSDARVTFAGGELLIIGAAGLIDATDFVF
jgi:Ca2+-binding RTX toxin-like protein